MSKIVLYLGGMAGDFISGCLSPSQIESMNISVALKPEYTKLKKFWMMSAAEKIEYINNFSDSIFLSSHDTNLSLANPNQTIRIVCSNKETLNKLSSRFRLLHKTEVLEHLSKQHNINVDNFDVEYTQLCWDWNCSFNFPCTLDISNIFEDSFVGEFKEFCQQHNLPVNNIEDLHKTWKEQNENFIR